MTKIKGYFCLLNYERRAALADQGWSWVGMLAVFTVLNLALAPGDRLEILVFFGEPLPAFLSGFLAARLVILDYEAGRLPFLLTRHSLRRLWTLRFALLMVAALITVSTQTILARAFSPNPYADYLGYLPLTGFVSTLFFVLSSSLVVLVLRQSLGGDLWTLFWGVLSVTMAFPTQEAHLTGLGPFFPFPVWFIHRRTTDYPELRSLLRASERIPEHLVALALLSLLLWALHAWALRRLKQYGV